MSCEECDRIFLQIRNADEEVLRTKALYDHKYERFKDLTIAGVCREAIKVHRTAYLEAMFSWIDAKTDKKRIHKSLTKHYREVYFNG